MRRMMSMNENVLTIVLACVGSAGLWSVVNLLIARHYKKHDDNDVVRRALKGLLYTDCIEWCQKYIDAGSIDIRSYNELLRYHVQPYRDLGGDGTIDSMMEIVEDLLHNRH
jgi:hypothetical protein